VPSSSVKMRCGSALVSIELPRISVVKRCCQAGRDCSTRGSSRPCL
jgi:hypothetical protein